MTTQVTIQTAPAAATTTTTPAPGTPEHAAQMVAAFEADQKQPPLEGTVAPAATTTTPPAAEGDKAPEGTPAADDKSKEDEPKPKEGDTPAEGLAALKEFAVVTDHLTEDGTFKPEALEKLTKIGIPTEIITGYEGMVKEVRELREFKTTTEAKALTATLHQAAGGQAQFDALVAWGKANLNAAEKAHMDAQLNGPFAADAIALLKVRAGAGKPSADPSMHQATSGASGGMAGYASLAEQQADFRNPKYQTDPAFRELVRRRLALTK